MNVKIIRSSRKSISLEITEYLTLIVRAPDSMSNEDISAFINKKRTWIEKHMSRLKTEAAPAPQFTREEINALKNEAKVYFPPCTEHFASIIGVSFNKITIRSQTKRWGSASSNNNLNFNCLLMLCPESVREYIIIHELCHLIEMNHSASFWALVSKFCPAYKESEAYLKEHGSKLIRRLK